MNKELLISGEPNFCNIIRDDNFLYLAMPNGDIIPMQTDLIIQNNMSSDKGAIEVTIKVLIPLNDAKKAEFNKKLCQSENSQSQE